MQDLPKDVVFAKRLLGRSWSDPFIQTADHRLWSFTIIRSSWGKPLILGEQPLQTVWSALCLSKILAALLSLQFLALSEADN